MSSRILAFAALALLNSACDRPNLNAPSHAKQVSVASGEKASETEVVDSLVFAVGESQAIPSDAYGSAANVSFESSDPTVATVSEDGRIVAVGPGNAVVTVKGEDGSILLKINVKVTSAREKTDGGTGSAQDTASEALPAVPTAPIVDGSATPSAEKSLRTIVCRKTDLLVGNGDARGYSFAFTAAECGGQVPDEHFVGALAKMDVCGRDGSARVIQAWEGAAGMSIWALGGCGREPPTPSQLEAVFRELPGGAVGKAGGFATATARPGDVIFCEKTSVSPKPETQGPYDIDFDITECGGKVPDGRYVAALASPEICGFESSVIVRQPATNIRPGLTGWRFGQCGEPASASILQVVYFKRLSPPEARLCSTAAMLPKTIVADVQPETLTTERLAALRALYGDIAFGPHLLVHDFSAAECEGAVPGPDTVGVVTSYEICGIEESVTVRQPGDGAAGIAAWYMGGCPANPSASTMGALFLKK